MASVVHAAAIASLLLVPIHREQVSSDMKLPNGESAPVGVRRGANDMPEFTIPDISNIGAKPRRVVHARAVGTDLL